MTLLPEQKPVNLHAFSDLYLDILIKICNFEQVEASQLVQEAEADIIQHTAVALNFTLDEDASSEVAIRQFFANRENDKVIATIGEASRIILLQRLAVIQDLLTASQRLQIIELVTRSLQEGS